MTDFKIFKSKFKYQELGVLRELSIDLSSFDSP